MLDSLRSLKELLFPLSCLGCATADYWLCPTCQSNWKVSTRKTLIGSNPLYFKADYSVKTSAVILAAKESNNHLARDLLAMSISQSIIYAMADLAITGDIYLVTIPSSISAIRRRGRDHIQELAIEVQNYLELKSIKSHLLFFFPSEKI